MRGRNSMGARGESVCPLALAAAWASLRADGRGGAVIGGAECLPSLQAPRRWPALAS